MTDDILLERPYLFLGSRLKRVAEQLQADVIRLSQADGLPIQPGQYPLLATLDRFGPKTVGDLARAMKLTQPTVTRTVARLVELGLIRVDQLHADRRQKTISLTPAGEAAMAQSKRSVWPLVEQSVKAAVDALSGSLLEQIGELERRLSQGTVTAAAGPLLTLAADADIPSVVALLNVAFRGAGPDASWNSEADYMEGDRATVPGFRAELAAKPGAKLLLLQSEPLGLKGCVVLEPRGDGLWFLGSLAVDPKDQNSGLGRRVLEEAERWVTARGGVEIQMTVVNVRDTLIAWYQRRGYRLTGETHPFPYEDERFGVPRRSDLCFVVLKKALG